MSFTAAVASGDRAVADLDRRLVADHERGGIAKTVYRGHVVAWTARHPWVTSFDDGEVLVVLDGQVHQPLVERVAQSEFIAGRYREFGEEYATGLLGEFVCIVLDRPKDRLVVSRDPVGVRPWFQTSRGQHYAGATDLATVASLPWVDVSLDEEVGLQYLAGIARSSGGTFYREIVTLAPGSTWTSTRPSPRGRSHHQWRIEPEPEIGWDEAVERCTQVFREVVQDRVRVAGAATSELSGGLDSSAVVGTLVDLGHDDVLAGRLLFDGTDADERDYSDAVLTMWGLRHVSAAPWLPPDHEFEALSRSLRRPVPDPNFTMTASLHRAFLDASRTSALTGLGGDDAFLNTTLGARVVSSFHQRRVADLIKALRADVTAPRGAWRRTWRPLLAYFAGRGRPAVPAYISEEAAVRGSLAERMHQPVMPFTGDRAVDERLSGLTSGYLAGIFEEAAVVHDWSGWRSSHPFFDPRFIRASYGLNPWFPVRGGHDRALEVAVFEHVLPSADRTRRSKADFAEVAWARPTTDSAKLRVVSGPLSARGWLEPAGVDKVFNDAKMGRAGAALPFSRLIAMDSWLRQESPR